MIKKKKLSFYFRINSDKSVGIGHLMRSLRLAKQLKLKGHSCVFCIDKKINLETVIKDFKIIYLYKSNESFKNQISDANLFLNKINYINSMVIIDDYRLSYLWEKHVSKKVNKIIVFDDLEIQKHYSDIYINYKPTFENYANFNQKIILKKNCKILIGPKYNVIECIAKKSKKKKLFTFCFYLGGSGNLLKIYRIIQSLILKKIKNFEILVIAGPYAKNLNLIEKLSKKFSSIKIIKGEYSIDKVISKVDLLIGSAGNIVYESSYYNIPSLFFEISKNQKTNIFSMEKIGHYFVLPNRSFKEISKISELIFLMYINYKKIFLLSKNKEIKIDNTGISRIVDAIFSTNKKITTVKKNRLISNNKKINYKILKIEDGEINKYLYSRNSVSNREVSTISKKISNLDHYIWWLTTSRNSLYLIKNNEVILALYDEIIRSNSKNYSFQGWFSISKNCSLKDILFALIWQKKYIKNKKNINLSISMVKKSNKINLSKYLGWKLVDKYSEAYTVLKKTYKPKDNHLFYER